MVSSTWRARIVAHVVTAADHCRSATVGLESVPEGSPVQLFGAARDPRLAGPWRNPVQTKLHSQSHIASMALSKKKATTIARHPRPRSVRRLATRDVRHFAAGHLRNGRSFELVAQVPDSCAAHQSNRNLRRIAPGRSAPSGRFATEIRESIGEHDRCAASSRCARAVTSLRLARSPLQGDIRCSSSKAYSCWCSQLA